MPGYAYPRTGKVLAVSKKLLEVTPEALEERRRKLEDSAELLPDQAHRKLPGFDSSSPGDVFRGIREMKLSNAADKILESEPDSHFNPCRRRLDGTKMTAEERRRLGVTACVDFDGSTASFAVRVPIASRSPADTGFPSASEQPLVDGAAVSVVSCCAGVSERGFSRFRQEQASAPSE